MLLLLASGVAADPGRAHAASAATEADAALKHGVELRRRGDDAPALQEFQRAYALQRSARALAQIGFAEQALGRWRDAEEHLGQALADGDDLWIRGNRATLERSRAIVAGHLGSLDVLGGPEGAVLRVDGRAEGRLPLARPVRVAAGSVGIELRAEGYLPATRPVTITAGELSRETIMLQRLEVAPATAGPGISPAITPTQSPVALAPAPPGAALPAMAAAPYVPDDLGDGGWERTAAWVSAGVAVLVAGGAAVAVVARGQYADQVASAVRDNRCTQAGDRFTGVGAEDCANAATDRDRSAMLALLGGGVAGAFAVASAIFFVATPRADAGARSAAVRARFACAPAGGGALLQCGGWF